MEELAQDKLNLIAKIIKNDKKFSGNEDLFEDFFNETCKRSFIIAKTVKSETTLTTYVKRIASTSILTVLKDTGRLRRTREGYIPTQTLSLETVSSGNVDYSEAVIRYEAIDFEDSPEDIVIKNEILHQVLDNLYKINKAEPKKKYLHIFKLRYEEGMTQKEIAEQLGISQSEVSKRLFGLMEKIKQAFN